MKYFSTLIAFALFVTLTTSAQAQIGVVDVKIKTQAEVTGNKNVGASTSASATAQAGEKKNENASSSASSNRSGVSVFVQSLLDVADRDGGIGADVRVVAQDQNESDEKTAEAKAEVEARGSLKTFFLGTDYKNLGVIRSEVAKTKNNIAKLNVLLEKATVSARGELEAQIEALEEVQDDLEAYIEKHEDKFSLFGWFAKIFVETEVEATN
jgi:hypothetical protein